MTQLVRRTAVVRKEIRALAPTWLATAVAVFLAAQFPDRWIQFLGVVAYMLGSVTLGAQSIGHEYTHRTLDMLLTQPTERRRLFVVKLTVLAAMIVSLSVIAWSTVPERMSRWPEPFFMATLPTIGALFIAPMLTMLGRSTLAGAVLTLCIPGLLLIASQVAALAGYQLEPLREVDLATRWGWLGATGVLALATGVMWRMFSRLEAIGGSGPLIEVPWFAAADRGHVRHPLWLLAAKELRLQQMTLAIAIIYVLFAAIVLISEPNASGQNSPLVPVTVLYLLLLSLLIGALASAEERQLGTIESQLLLPMALWQQWMVKVTVAVGLALLMTIGVPAALVSLGPWAPQFHRAAIASRGMAIAAVVLTSAGLYVSSLCTSGVRALVLSLPALIGTWWFIGVVSAAAARMLARVNVYESPAQRLLNLSTSSRGANDLLVFALLAGFASLLLWLAAKNHRSAERNVGRVAGQVACIAAFLVVGVVLLAP
jgi:ABC-type transport system involved in multi-copper enzyme maturation permease subunit